MQVIDPTMAALLLMAAAGAASALGPAAPAWQAPALCGPAPRALAPGPSVPPTRRTRRPLRASMAGGEAASAPALRRLAGLARAAAEGGGAAEDALRAAVAGISLDDFGTSAAGWARCCLCGPMSVCVCVCDAVCGCGCGCGRTHTRLCRATRACIEAKMCKQQASWRVYIRRVTIGRVLGMLRPTPVLHTCKLWCTRHMHGPVGLNVPCACICARTYIRPLVRIYAQYTNFLSHRPCAHAYMHADTLPTD